MKAKRTIEEVLAEETVLANAETIVKSPNSTIEPSRGRSVEHARGLLAQLQTRRDDLDTRFRIESTLGHGGMGIVRLAEQTSLGRHVAVKTLRPDREGDEAAIVKMLQEAWITGSLEHPNVVPIYDMHVDEAGRPHIVLKRIDGQPWEELIHDARLVKRRFGADDLVEWNLSILMQVCNAVAFAHSRGIVHRDLKPENIMIGEFGEVYILDWGIAVCVDDDHDGRFPHVSGATDMAGTPCYMAPEMLGGEEVRICRQTDVYLLGAMLYEIVADGPPHDGDTLQEIVGSIILSAPALPEETPEELARIVRRAMDADPHARFENAVQIRLALQAFTRHQGSRRLAQEAEKRRVELLHGIETNGLTNDPFVQDQLLALFAECRFGFAEALRAWPENVEAANRLRDITVRVVEYQLALGQPRVAAASLAGLVEPPPSLLAAVDEAVRRQDAEHRVLAQLGRELDSTTGSRTRTMLALIAGTTWAIAPFVRSYLDLEEGYGLALAPAVFLALGGLMFVWGYDSMTKTAINRFIVAAIANIFVVEIAFAVASIRLGVPPSTVYVLSFLLWALGSGFVAMVAEWRLFSVTVCYFIGFFTVVVHPEWRVVVSSICHSVTTVLVVVLWAPPDILVRLTGASVENRSRSMALFRIGRGRHVDGD